MGAPARSGHEACTAALENAGSILTRTHPEFVISKYRMRQVDGISLVRKNRESGTQRLAFSSRPFVLCGLPVRRPPAGQLLYERGNGHFLLQLTGHPDAGSIQTSVLTSVLTSLDHSPNPPCRPPQISGRVLYDGRPHPIRQVLRRAIRRCARLEGPRINGVYILHEQEHAVGWNAGAVLRLSQFHHGVADPQSAMHDAASGFGNRHLLRSKCALEKIDLLASVLRMQIRQHGPFVSRGGRPKPCSDVPVVPESVLHKGAALAVRPVCRLPQLTHEGHGAGVQCPPVYRIAV